MKGHIRERSPGRWAIVLEIRDPATGSRRRKWHTFVGTKRQAQGGWTCTRTYCPACRPTRRPALTRSCGKR